MQSVTGRAKRELRLFKAKYSKRTGTSGNYKYEYDDFGDRTARGVRDSMITDAFLNAQFKGPLKEPPFTKWKGQKLYYSEPKGSSKRHFDALMKEAGGGKMKATMVNFFKQTQGGHPTQKSVFNHKGKSFEITNFVTAENSLIGIKNTKKYFKDNKGYTPKGKGRRKKSMKEINDRKLAPIAQLLGGDELLASLSIGSNGTIFLYDASEDKVIPIAGSVGELARMLRKTDRVGGKKKKGLFSFGRKR